MSKICFITGSSRGIGLTIAQKLAQVGYRVILNSRKPLNPEVLERFQHQDLEVDYVIGNIGDFQFAKEAIAYIKDKYGRLDVLINNAGITRDGLLLGMSEEAFDQVIETNLKGTFNCCRHAINLMIKQRQGIIINMSSLVGLTGNAGQVNYAASKAGMIGLTKSLAREVASRHIRVNAIAPGFIETDMTDGLQEKQGQALLKSIPLGRFGQADEIVSCVEFLINNEYITGQTIEVNGGLHM